MKDFCLPNYKDGSIINLMSSIARARGGRTPYNPLKILFPNEIKDSKNIILIVIDGLGYNYLIEKGKKSILYSHLRGAITSVFLPTTAAAITSFLTGVPPQQHAYTGWFMNLKEIGVVTKILPFSPRVGGPVLSKQKGVKISDIMDTKSFASRLKCKSFITNPKDIAALDLTFLMSKKAINVGFGRDNINKMFRQIKKAVNSSSRKKYIYAYWPGFDASAHETGVNSKKTERHFKQIDKKLGKFIKSLKGTDTTLIITSDHGFINTPESRNIWIEDHPVFQECLTVPLCGEGRTPFCYVHPSKAKKFERYVKTKMKKYCYIFKTEELIKKNYFGFFEPHKKLFDRLGDYLLLCKENYRIKDSLNKKRNDYLGHHGGMSKDEMIVPLIVINFK